LGDIDAVRLDLDVGASAAIGLVTHEGLSSHNSVA
jgi:hypothetical protein